MKYIYYTSHGKDSMAGLHVAIDILGWPVDRVIHSTVWATCDIQGNLPKMVEFKKHAEAEIKRRWGLTVETPPEKHNFEELFYTPYQSKASWNRTIRGWPLLKGSWCA